VASEVIHQDQATSELTDNDDNSYASDVAADGASADEKEGSKSQ
jgi:hypothetical protein